MKRILKIFRQPELYIVLLLAFVLVVLKVSAPVIKNVTLERRSETKEVVLPILERMGQGEVFSVKFGLNTGWSKELSLKLVPDDCVLAMSINGKALDPKLFPGYCDWASGFTLTRKDFEKHVGLLKEYSFNLKIRNNGGAAGLSALMKAGSFGSRALSIVAALLFGLLVFLIGSRFRLHKGILLIFLLGLALRGAYFQETSYSQRAYDVDGHIEYVGIVADEHRIPDNKECWTCYHPPLYYLSAIPFWEVSFLFDYSKPRALQWYSFIMSALALIFGLYCLRMLLTGGGFWLAALLWTFWPSLVMMSPRVTNEAMFCMAHVICFWAILRYMATRNGTYVILSVALAAMAYWAKSTGIITIAMLGLMFLVYFVPSRLLSFERKKKSEYVGLVLFLALCGIVGGLVLFNPDIVGNSKNLNSALIVGAQPGNMLYFDLENFLTHPYTSAWDDNMGRQYFLNYLAKTSLFGEFQLLKTTAGNWLATIISISLLGLVGFALVGLWRIKWNAKTILSLAQIVMFVVAVAALRLKYPYSCSNDFRFILPVLIPCICLSVEGIFAENGSVRRRVAGVFLVLIFSGCSTALMLLL